VTAEFLAPVLVEVDEKVEPPIEVEAWVPVEVGMDTELAATRDLVKPSAVETRIGNELGDSGELAEELEERDGVEMIQEDSRQRPERRLRCRGELDLPLVVEAVPTDLSRCWELGQDLLKERGIEEVVEHGMRERLCVQVGGVRGLRQLPHAGQRQERAQ
jgi:hypothetical protein